MKGYLGTALAGVVLAGAAVAAVPPEFPKTPPPPVAGPARAAAAEQIKACFEPGDPQALGAVIAACTKLIDDFGLAAGPRSAALAERGLAFLRQDAFYPAPVARSDASLIGFYGAGDAGRARGISHGTAGGQERQRHRRAQDIADLGLHAAGR